MKRSYFQKTLRSLGLLIFVFLFLVIACTANPGIETTLSKSITSSVNNPAIDGTRIVWDDNGHIFLYDITTGNLTKIVNDPGIQQLPSIAGNLIAWQNSSISDYDIYLYNLTDQTKHTITSSHSAGNPAISGDKIVWQDQRNGDYDIYLYNLTKAKEYPLTPGTVGSDQWHPAISGNKVVWEDYRYPPTPVVFMNDTSTWTTSRISSDTTGTYYQGVPSISGNKIVWVDDFPNFPNSSIMLSQIGGGEEQISDGNSGPSSDGLMAPSIDGNWVVWVDYKNDPDNGQIYLNKTDTPPYSPIPIATSAFPKYNPKISGDRIVWEEQNSLGLYDLHLFTIDAVGSCPPVTFSEDTTSGGVPLTVSFTDSTTPEYSPVHWFWDFGDGTVSYLQNPLHQYGANGQYLVNLTISDAYCRNLSASHTITVGSPVAQFTGTPTSGLVPLDVQFTDSSTGTSIHTWNWSFGDNTWYNTTDSSNKNPLHHYDEPGTYTVRLFVTNAYGTGSKTRSGYITVLQGAHALATTPVNGIGIDNLYGGQYMRYNSAVTGSPVVNSAHSVLESSPPVANGWQNITFIASDEQGFTDTGGGIYRGNISRVYLQTIDVAARGFSPALNDTVFVSYLMDLPLYPDPASLKTEVWENALAEDNSSLSSIALHSGFTGVDAVAYTAVFTRTNIGSNGNTTVNMSVKSSWVAGPGSTNITAIGTDPSTGNKVGTILNTRYAGTDGTLDYFIADLPPHYSYFSKFILAKYSGSGNPFQIVTLTVASYISGIDNTGSSESSKGVVSSPVAVQPTASVPLPTPTPPDPGKTAGLYINSHGVITQATTLMSTDTRATLLIGLGIVAKDRDGNPLPSVTIKSVPPSVLPGLPPPGTVSFAGMAYEISPNSATFSPDITLTFTYPDARWGEDYSIKEYDPSTNAWIDLPTMYSPEKGTITASLSHFCYFALFLKTKNPAPRLTAPNQEENLPAPTPEAPPGTAVNIWINMLIWVAEQAVKNLVYIAVAALVIVLIYFMRRKKRMDRIRYML